MVLLSSSTCPFDALYEEMIRTGSLPKQLQQVHGKVFVNRNAGPDLTLATVGIPPVFTDEARDVTLRAMHLIGATHRRHKAHDVEVAPVLTTTPTDKYTKSRCLL